MLEITSRLLLLVGTVFALAGIVMQRHALRSYAGPGVPRGVTLNPAGWWPTWRVAERLTDARGVRAYLKGDALFAWGMMMVGFALGFIAGRW